MSAVTILACALATPILGQFVYHGAPGQTTFTGLGVLQNADGSVYRVITSDGAALPLTAANPITGANSTLPAGNYDFSVVSTQNGLEAISNVTINGLDFGVVRATSMPTSIMQTIQFTVGAQVTVMEGEPQCAPWQAKATFLNVTASDAVPQDLAYAGLGNDFNTTATLDDYNSLNYQDSTDTSAAYLCLMGGLYRNIARSATPRFPFLTFGAGQEIGADEHFIIQRAAGLQGAFTYQGVGSAADMLAQAEDGFSSVMEGCPAGKVPWSLFHTHLLQYPEEYYFHLLDATTGALAAQGADYGAMQPVCLEPNTDYFLRFFQHYPDVIVPANSGANLLSVVQVGEATIVTDLNPPPSLDALYVGFYTVTFNTGAALDAASALAPVSAAFVLLAGFALLA